MFIFSDWHHQDLKYSLQLLLEKRLGHHLYFPIGMEWYEKGYWNIYPHVDTAKQYLDLQSIYVPKDGTPVLNEQMGFKDVYTIEDKHNNSSHKAITFEMFKNAPIDIVIASIPAHIKPFKELAKMKGAKFIFQQGNMFSEVLNNLHEIPNLLSSTVEFPVPQSCNAVFYHQEFDTTIFRPTTLPPKKQITNFINILGKNNGYVDYLSLKAEMPDWDFKSYGAQNDDGVMNTTKELALEMQRNAWGFHSKRMGDGFGHILYNWFACGRPIITRISDYKGKLGEELLEDKETCLDLDIHSYSEIYSIISNLPPIEYDYYCQQVRNRFLEKVNFDQEEIKIREFIKNLK